MTFYFRLIKKWPICIGYNTQPDANPLFFNKKWSICVAYPSPWKSTSLGHILNYGVPFGSDQGPPYDANGIKIASRPIACNPKSMQMSVWELTRIAISPLPYTLWKHIRSKSGSYYKKGVLIRLLTIKHKE